METQVSVGKMLADGKNPNARRTVRLIQSGTMGTVKADGGLHIFTGTFRQAEDKFWDLVRAANHVS